MDFKQHISILEELNKNMDYSPKTNDAPGSLKQLFSLETRILLVFFEVIPLRKWKEQIRIYKEKICH